MLAAKHVATTGSGDTGLKQLASYHLKETSGTTPTVINIRDGGVGGTIVIPVRLAANEFADMSFSHPLLSTNNWYFELVSGTVVGSVSGR